MIVNFAFNKIFESDDGAVRFFRSIGVRNPSSAETLELLQAVAGLRQTLEHLPKHTQRSIKSQAKAAFKTLVGEDIHAVATRFDSNVPYQEMAGADMMPRKDQQIGRAKALNMKMSDEIMQTTMEATDPESFEVIGKPQFATTKMLRDCAQDAANTDVHGVGVISGVLAMDQMGAIAHALAGAEEPNDDFTLDVEWFSDATQDLLDRSSTGESWSKIVGELARQFAEFFDGSEVAFSFAADALGRRAWEMGLWESRAMVEAWERDGNFLSVKIPVTETIKYRNKPITLNRTGPIRVLRLAEDMKSVKIKNRSRT